MKYLSKANLKKFRGKTCLLRVDLNIEPGQEKNSFRLDALLPTIRLLLKNKVRVVILSHRGRPRGYDRKLSLRPFVSIIQKKLRQEVKFVAALPHAVAPQDGKVFLLENLRFWRGEEKNDKNFAKKLASLGDFYVNDAFAVSHRKNASVVAITKYLPSYAGLSFEKEIKNLGGILKYTTRPFTVILGGAKISDKLGVLKYFWNKADRFLLAGGPANTFFAAQGFYIGNSIFDQVMIPEIKKYSNSDKIILPQDLKIADRKILDIGPKTVQKFAEIISHSKTIIWNGPAGFFENRGFREGTKGLWQAILKNKKARIVVGGGETLASLKLIIKRPKLKTNNQKLFFSTGGGAMLEFLSGKKLPGIEALKK